MRNSTILSLFLFLFVFRGFSQLAGYDLSNIVVVPGTTDPVSGIILKEEAELNSDKTLDIVNWNISFFGAPQMVNYKYGNREEHINRVAQKLVETDADVYALQEVVVDAVNGNALTNLLVQMNILAGSEKYSGMVSPHYSFWWQGENSDFPPQCLAFVWNTETVSVKNDSTLLQDIASSNDFGYGRLPFLLDAHVTLNGKTQRYMFINIHLKAGTGDSEMRAGSMRLLKELLNVNFHANNVVLLGDFNNADQSGALGEIREWGMYRDDEQDGLADYVHAAGNKNNGIEHTLLSNELFDELAYIPEHLRNVTLSGTGILLSDHYAYKTSLYVHEETGGSDPENNPLFSSSNTFSMTKADYRIIVEYVKNDQALSALDTNPYADSEYYFGASAYYSNFDIRSGKYHSSFGSWEEAVKTAISTILLPAKYSGAQAGGTLYTVTFQTYSGVSGQHSFSFICTKSAPDPEFAWYSGNNNMVTQNPGEVKVYPNPAVGWITLSSSSFMVSCSFFNLQGQELKKILLNKVRDANFDVSFLKRGAYFIKANGITGETGLAKFYVE